MQAAKNNDVPLKLNSTAQRRLEKEIAKQSKKAIIEKVAKANIAKGVVHQVQQKRLKQIGEEEEKKQLLDNKDVEIALPGIGKPETDMKSMSKLELTEKS